jgi:hypothetical protein
MLCAIEYRRKQVVELVNFVYLPVNGTAALKCAAKEESLNHLKCTVCRQRYLDSTG